MEEPGREGLFLPFFQQLRRTGRQDNFPSSSVGLGIQNVEQEIYKAPDDVMMEFSATTEVPSYSEVIDDCWEEIKGRQDSGAAGIPFKFSALNDYATIECSELFIFGAEQKQGKSMMLLNCAVDLLKQDYAVLYLDSELNTRLFTARILAHLSGVEYRRLTTGAYSQEEEERIIKAKDWMKTQKFTHIYIPTFDQQSIYTAVKKVYGMPQEDLYARLRGQFPITDELVEFAEHYQADPRNVSMLLTIPRYLRVGYEFSRVDQILELEFTKLLESDVRFRKCQRCGRYFILKGNFNTRYCDRIEEYSGRTCQDMAAKENFKRKAADRPALGVYDLYYRRYAARKKVRQ